MSDGLPDPVRCRTGPSLTAPAAATAGGGTLALSHPSGAAEKGALAGDAAWAVPWLAPELAVVIPTFNERANIGVLLELLEACLTGVVAYEVIIVDDDSPDGTAAGVRELTRRDPRLRCLQRIGRRGLASACVEGMLASSAPYLAVMDADLQHDERLLPAMVARLRRGDVDLVVGTRYMTGTKVPGWDERRQRVSRLATRLTSLALGTALSDPMSGFFAIRRDALESVVRGLSAIGFKLLLDILATTRRPPLRVAELPYRFRPRRAGKSKLDARVALDFLALLADKLVGRWVPVRFLLFAAVGALGVLVHLAILALAFRLGPLTFVPAQTLAALAAMTFNFALNNELTYRDVRLRGWRWLNGLASFVLACGIGLSANVGIAAVLHGQQAGWVVSALAGIAIGLVWNYAVTSALTWRRR